MWKESLKALIVLIIYRFFLFTWKIKIHEGPQFAAHLKTNKPYVLAHWHGDELALLCVVQKYKLATMVSKSKDGALMHKLYTHLGGTTTRGSSSKGAISALKGLIRLIKNGHPTSVAVDGPRGPIHKAKPGVFEISRLSSSPIFGVGVHVNRTYRSKKSWNKAIFPKLFARLNIYIDFQMDAVSKADNPRSEELANTLEERIFNARRQAGKLVENT